MCSDCFEEGDVELVDEYVEGDVLIDDDDDELCVLGVCGKTYLMSEFNDPEEAGSFWTRKDLDNSGFALKSSLTQPKEMTVEEISKKLGHPVKVVKG